MYLYCECQNLADEDNLSFQQLLCYFAYQCKLLMFLNFQALSGIDSAIARKARLLGNTALDAALNAQFLVQIGIFTAVPMIIGFILEQGLMQVCSSIF